METSLWWWDKETKCKGKNCPKKESCSRYMKNPIQNYFLASPWNKRYQDCPAFERKE